MLSEIPIDLSKVPKDRLDFEILRAGIIAEADAINLYEQMAAMARSESIKKILNSIAKEEKTHSGEFEAMLLELDKEQGEENLAGRKEVREMGIAVQGISCPSLYVIKERVLGRESTTYVAAHSEDQAWQECNKKGLLEKVREACDIMKVADNLCDVKPGAVLGACYE